MSYALMPGRELNNAVLRPSTPLVTDSDRSPAEREANKLVNERMARKDLNTIDSRLLHQLRNEAKTDEGALEVLRKTSVDGYTGAERKAPNQPPVGVLEAPIAQEPTEEAPVVAQPVTEDLGTNPGGALTIMNRNQMAGVGNYVGAAAPPPPPNPMEQQAKQMSMEAKQTMFDQNKIPVWYESSSFNMGLLNFGLNLLSGNDLASSFAAAGKAFDDGFAREKRQAWANDLVDQGYDAQDIQRWIETGDNKDLTDPMEKQMKVMQYNTQAAQLDDLLYRTSPQMREYEMGRQQWQDQMTVDEFNARRADSARNYNLQVQKFNLENEKAAKKAAGGEFTSRDYSQLQSSIQPTIRVANQRIAYSNDALRDVEQIKGYKAVRDDPNATPAQKQQALDGIRGSYKSFQANMARAMKGGGATLTNKDLEATTALPDWMGNMSNAASLKLTGVPSDEWVDAMYASVKNDAYNQTQGVRQIFQNAYDTWAPIVGHEQAQLIVSRLAGGTSMGDVRINPNTGQFINDSSVSRVGPDTVKITR